jgi:dTDP-4-amino-4,6-dideoxygalactose transaminase
MKYFGIDDLWASLRCVWGDQKSLFEKEFAQYIGAKFAIGTSYGRTALYLGLRAIDVREKEVIIPAFICTVVRHAVIAAGGIPRFVDVDLGNFNFKIDDLRRKITQRTKALILVHYFGRVAGNMDEVIQVARGSSIAVVEDCAHSLGAEYNGEKIGTLGDVGTFSLTKNTINFGGGVLVTNNDLIHENARTILKNEKISRKKRLADFPIVIAYGLEQIADKALFETVKSDLFKQLIRKLPNLLLEIRKFVIGGMKQALILTGVRHRGVEHSTGCFNGGSETTIYSQGIHMQPIIASVGRTQLRKIEHLSLRRKKICDQLSKLRNYHFGNLDGFTGKDVYTHVVLRFPREDIFQVIEECKNAGILLKATWPTHQKLWDDQVTETVKTIEREILTWNVNPDLTDEKVRRFIEIVSGCANGGAFLQENAKSRSVSGKNLSQDSTLEPFHHGSL